MHFTHHHCDAAYFDELTCEKLKKKYEKGFPVRYWEKPVGARNEVLDCNVYAYAALLSLSEQPAKLLDRLRAELLEEARKIKEKQDPRQISLLEGLADSLEEKGLTETAARIKERVEDMKTASPPEPIKEEAHPAETAPPSEEQPESGPDRPARARRPSSWLTRY
jgi:phage terminase large subunit GpA-like protein